MPGPRKWGNGEVSNTNSNSLYLLFFFFFFFLFLFLFFSFFSFFFPFYFLFFSVSRVSSWVPRIHNGIFPPNGKKKKRKKRKPQGFFETKKAPHNNNNNNNSISHRKFAWWVNCANAKFVSAAYIYHTLHSTLYIHMYMRIIQSGTCRRVWYGMAWRWSGCMGVFLSQKRFGVSLYFFCS